MGTATGFVCGPVIYEYAGWLFEVHSYHGPWPLKKDWSPRERAGRRFFAMYDRFEQEPDKRKFEVAAGGCQRI